MVLESPERLGEFFLESYKKSRQRYGNVLENPRDVHDMEFPAYVADNAHKIHVLALRLKEAFPHVPDEDHALMAYLLHVIAAGAPVNGSPHIRVLRAPRRFFLEYVKKALGEDAFKRLADDYKYSGIPVSEILKHVRDHNLPSHVLERRFLFR